MALTKIFTMPYAPEASENHMYGQSKTGRRFLNSRSRSWRTKLTRQVQEWIASEGVELSPLSRWTLEIYSYFPPTGGRIPDLGDYLKIIADGVRNGFGKEGPDDHAKALPDIRLKTMSTSADKPKFSIHVTLYEPGEEV